MRVIGIDPGYDRLGVAVLEGRPGQETLLHSCCISSDTQSPLSERLYTIGSAFSEIVDTYQPTVVGIETLFFNKNVKTAIDVAQARGVISYLAVRSGAAVCELSPQSIKVAVTGHGGSDKTAVTTMVRRLLPNVPTNALDDEYDAIAVALTCLAHSSGRQ
ncbi:MAG: crossover junction endodeoxyribonuclease RuvC [Patescibacteria group bacterium]